MRRKNLIQETQDLGTVDTNGTASTAINIIGGQVIGCQVVVSGSDSLNTVSIILQKSNDNVNWNNEGSATNITGDGTFFLEKIDPSGAFYRAYIALTGGTFDCNLEWVVKGLDG